MTTEYGLRRVACALLPLLLLSFPIRIQAEPSAPDSLSRDNILEEAALADQADPNGTAYELWQELTTPTSGDYVRVRLSGRAEESESESPSDYTFGRFQRGPLEATILYRKQMTEPGLRHMKGAAVWTMSPRGRLYLGSLRMDAGQGWTVASSPAWAFASDPRAPFRFPSRGLNANTSSESFRGFLGGGVSTLLSVPWLEGPLRIDAWGGRQEFPGRNSSTEYGRYDIAGTYSSASYTVYNPADITLHAIQAGGRFILPLPGDESQLELIHNQVHFQDPISSSQSLARFRYSQKRMQATGLAGRSMLFGARVRAEATYQEKDAWAGSVAANRDLGSYGNATARAWYISPRFCFATARPWLPFGSTAWDVNGYSVGWEKRHLLVDYLALTTAGQFTHLPSTNPPPASVKHHLGTWLTLRQHLGEAFELDVRAWQQGYIETASPVIPEETGDVRRSVRIALAHDDGVSRTTLRFQRIRVSGGGNGVLGGVDWRIPWGGSLGFAAAVTYLQTSGTRSGVTVVEPAGPGMFPVVTLAGEHLRASGRLETALLPGMMLWGSGTVDQQYVHEGVAIGDVTSLRWALGLDWRPGY